jgi:hypothetical protein
MCYSVPRSTRQVPTGWGGRGDRAAWLPLLFIGAMMFWTVAVGLGTWSLMVVGDQAAQVEAAGPAPTATEPMPGVTEIPVHMEESQEPEDVNDNAGSAAPALPGPLALPLD